MSQKEYPVIVVLDGEQVNQHWVLEAEETILGRDDSSDIVIPQRQISRQHVVFRRKGEDYYIQDLESKNGTWVNGLRLEGERKLGDGDEIHLALAVRLRFIGSGITAPVTQDLPDVIPTSFRQGRLQLDPESRRVFITGKELDPPLSLPQYRLLELLYTNNGGICTREQVVEAVWPDVMSDGVSEQAIDALVRRLRDRLNDVDPDYQYIVTVRGHGFRLDNPPVTEQGQPE
jgi:DNA-binding winged helix-turn-helix (wHTH) protein